MKDGYLGIVCVIVITARYFRSHSLVQSCRFNAIPRFIPILSLVLFVKFAFPKLKVDSASLNYATGSLAFSLALNKMSSGLRSSGTRTIGL
jgi:hypothetical protein